MAQSSIARLFQLVQKIGLTYDLIPVRMRLSLAYTLWMGVFYAFIGGVMYKLVERNLHDSVNSALISSAETLRDVRFAFTLADTNDALFDPIFRETWQLSQFLHERSIRPVARIINTQSKKNSIESQEQVVLPITPKAKHRAGFGLATVETFRISGRSPLRLVSLPILVDGIFTGELIQVGVFLGPTLETLHNTAFSLAAALMIALMISIIFGFALTRRAFRPVGDITAAAAQMDMLDLSIRLPVPPAHDELRSLSETFNLLFDKLEDALKRLRRFAGDVSHELRTPLAVLRGEAELALRRPRTVEEYQAILKQIAKEAHNMTAIVQDLLLFAKAESGTMALSQEKVPCAILMMDIAQDLHPIFSQKNIRLRLQQTPNQDIFVSRTYITLALKNILLNAIKHSANQSSVLFDCKLIMHSEQLQWVQGQTPPGWSYVWLGKLEKEQDYVCFSILDQGEGIHPELLGQIFDPFVRIDSARNRDMGGSGIGLSLTLALIRLHHGVICVQSKVGKGAQFLVYLPTEASTTT
ncbi:MAG: ATP-binding protein [Zetaproteobacteria bacterium]|nr:ATP-binding protein [Zetaproteobacteria bacterium]